MENRTRKQTGVGLVEVLIALLITAIGLLGLAALHGKAQKAEVESYQRAQAMVLLEDMVNRLRSNRTGKDSYALGDSDFVGTGSDFGGSGCDDDRACADLLDWHNSLLGSTEAISGTTLGALIGARGCITGGGNDFVVTVVWQGVMGDDEEVLPDDDPRNTNACGQNLYGSEAKRRIVSVPVRFFVSS